MDAMVWVGDGRLGSIVPESEALVSVFDHGLTVGDGVFETLKVTDQGAFAVTRHLDRLARSCAAMGLPMPDRDLVRQAIDEVVMVNAPVYGTLGRLRITVTAGAGPLGSERSDDDVTLIVAIAAQRAWPPTATLVTVPWRRNELSAIATVKSTSYAENVVALRYAHAHDASEGIFCNTQGMVCEGTGSNIFWVKDRQVFTPTLASGCLAGVTRALVVGWFDVTERDAPLSEVHQADEVFITSSTRDVQPVSRWDAQHWAEVGAITAAMQREFHQRSSTDIDP